MSSRQMSLSVRIFLPSAALRMDGRNETEKIDGDFAAARNLNGDLFKGPTASRGRKKWSLAYQATP